MMKKYVPKPGRREYVTFLLLFAEIILFGILAPNFLTVDNLIRVIQNNAEIAMVSIGMTIVMLLGGIDLSVGSVMGVIAIVIGYMLQAEMNIFLIVAAAIGIGVAVGFLNGFLVAKFNIPDMIVTIATMNIWKAVIFALLGGKWLTGLNPGYGVITRAKIFGIPVLLLFIIAIYALFYYFLMYRKFGRYIYATGCNPQSANLSGINVKKIYIRRNGGICSHALYRENGKRGNDDRLRFTDCLHCGGNNRRYRSKGKRKTGERYRHAGRSVSYRVFENRDRNPGNPVSA